MKTIASGVLATSGDSMPFADSMVAAETSLKRKSALILLKICREISVGASGACDPGLRQSLPRHLVQTSLPRVMTVPLTISSS